MAYTKNDIDRHIELVQSLAAQAGIERLTYGGGTFSGLRRFSAYGTHSLIAQLDDGSTGATEVSIARGTRECVLFLQGVEAALSAMVRFN